MPGGKFALILCVCALTICLGSPPVFAELKFDKNQALEASQASLGNKLGAYTFTDTRNQQVDLRSFLDKPLVVSLIFTGCNDICPMVSETIADAVEVARDALGADSFRVVTIGFDSRNDNPNRMRSYAASHGINVAGWNFLSADAATIDNLSRDLGFTFRPSPQGFDHLSQTSVIDTDGRVYRHVYGADFEAPLLVEPLKQLIFGQRIEMTSVEGIINRVKLFCTIYDPASGKYRFDYSIIIVIVMGALTLSGIGFVIARSLLSQWRASRHV